MGNLEFRMEFIITENSEIKKGLGNYRNPGFLCVPFYTDTELRKEIYKLK